MDISILRGLEISPSGRGPTVWELELTLELYERSADSVSPCAHPAGQYKYKYMILLGPLAGPKRQKKKQGSGMRERKHTLILRISPMNHNVLVRSGSRTAAAPLQYTKWKGFGTAVPGGRGILENASSAASVYSWFTFR
jgi:hypothetical protein